MTDIWVEESHTDVWLDENEAGVTNHKQSSDTAEWGMEYVDIIFQTLALTSFTERTVGKKDLTSG